MQAIGLSGFVAMVGIGAGPHFAAAIREAGIGLLLGGLVVTFVPLISGLYFGRYVLKIPPILLFGAISGAQTFTAALAAVQEKSGARLRWSATPVPWPSPTSFHDLGDGHRPAGFLMMPGREATQNEMVTPTTGPCSIRS